MKKLLLVSLLLSSIFSNSQSDLKTGYTYSFQSEIPKDDNEIKTNFFQFRFNNTVNHFLDKKSGSVYCENGNNQRVTIKLNNIGRIVFYTKVSIDSLKENSYLGNYTVNFYRKDVLIQKETRDLSQNWSEFHYNINLYNIDKVSIEFNPKIDKSLIYLDKIRIRNFTASGVSKLKNIYNENILLKSVTNDMGSQKDAIKNLSSNILKELVYYIKKLENTKTFIEGEELGSIRQKALNPFQYTEFDKMFKEITQNASYAEKIKINELKKDINDNKWVNVVGNITDVFTGGMFSSLINSLKNIINKGVVIDNQEIIVLNSKLYTLSTKGRLNIVNEDNPIFDKYTKIHKKYSDYISFIEILSTKQLIEINEENKFVFTKNKINTLIKEIQIVIASITSDANLTIEDGFYKGELDSNTLIEKYKEKLSITNTNFFNFKIKSQITRAKSQNISSSFYEIISEFKTYYDNKYSLEKLDLKALDKLNISKKIKEDWARNLTEITKKYKNSRELTNLKNLSKN